VLAKKMMGAALVANRSHLAVTAKPLAQQKGANVWFEWLWHRGREKLNKYSYFYAPVFKHGGVCIIKNAALCFIWRMKTTCLFSPWP